MVPARLPVRVPLDATILLFELLVGILRRCEIDEFEPADDNGTGIPVARPHGGIVLIHLDTKRKKLLAAGSGRMSPVIDRRVQILTQYLDQKLLAYASR